MHKIGIKLCMTLLCPIKTLVTYDEPYELVTSRKSYSQQFLQIQDCGFGVSPKWFCPVTTTPYVSLSPSQVARKLAEQAVQLLLERPQKLWKV